MIVHLGRLRYICAYAFGGGHQGLSYRQRRYQTWQAALRVLSSSKSLDLHELMAKGMLMAVSLAKDRI